MYEGITLFIADIKEVRVDRDKICIFIAASFSYMQEKCRH